MMTITIILVLSQTQKYPLFPQINPKNIPCLFP